MERFCSVPGCNSTDTYSSTQKRFFFPLPNDVERRKEWCRLIQRNELNGIKIFVCDLHFDKRHFERSTVWRPNTEQIPVPVEIISLSHEAKPTLCLNSKRLFPTPCNQINTMKSEPEARNRQFSIKLDKKRRLTCKLSLKQDDKCHNYAMEWRSNPEQTSKPTTATTSPLGTTYFTNSRNLPDPENVFLQKTSTEFKAKDPGVTLDDDRMFRLAQSPFHWDDKEFYSLLGSLRLDQFRV